MLLNASVVQRRMSDFSTIQARVRKWLAEAPGRRILLLLDEADHFLAADRFVEGVRRYPTVLELRQLAMDTDGAFKFVLAGLHDVQRTSRDPNTPLAQLGRPICIGPLLEGGEHVEARLLIEAPMAALGYRFAAPDLVTRILSYTNYYPSLIQQFCHLLVDHLSKPGLRPPFDPRSTPPYRIEERHIDDAYHAQSLREAIRTRFSLTLDLDKRYKLIALMMALEALDDREILVHGYDASEVRAKALEWWEAGFPPDERGLDVFRTLLDEMVGLGVLAKAGPDRWTLRSPNVLNLLGTSKDIEDALLGTTTEEAKPTYNHLHFRRADKDEVMRRSPLTGMDESRLAQRECGTAIVFGARAASRHQLSHFLSLTSGLSEVREPPRRLDDPESLCKWLSTLLVLRNQLIFALVDESHPWDERWIKDGRSFLQRHRSRERIIRLLFVGDPLKAWHWLECPEQVRTQIESELGVERINLRPWHETAVRSWLFEAGFGTASNEARQRLSEVTGNWGELLCRFADRCREKTHRWPELLEGFARETDASVLAPLFELVPEAVAALRMLADLGTAGTLEEICNHSGIDLALARRTASWAEMLGYAHRDHSGWIVPTVVLQALEGASA